MVLVWLVVSFMVKYDVRFKIMVKQKFTFKIVDTFFFISNLKMKKHKKTIAGSWLVSWAWSSSCFSPISSSWLKSCARSRWADCWRSWSWSNTWQYSNNFFNSRFSRLK